MSDADEGWLDFPTEPGWWWHTVGRWDSGDGRVGWSHPEPVLVTEIVAGLALGGTRIVGRAPEPDWRERVEAARKRDPFGSSFAYDELVHNGRGGRIIGRRALMHHYRWKRLELPRVPWYVGRPE